MTNRGVALALLLAACGSGGTTLPPTPDAAVVNAVPPETTLLEGPAPTTRMTHATFTFGASEGGATFECALDGAAFAACVSPAERDVGEGRHSFAVRARSGGAVDATPATIDWRVDLTPPRTTISVGPAASMPMSEASFSFDADEDVTGYACTLDGGPARVCRSGVAYSALSLGPHTFAVRATDVATNVETDAATWTWTVTAVTPETTITSGPTSPWNMSSVDFAFAADVDGATFECHLDKEASAACGSPAHFDYLDEGDHTFEVTAIDRQGRRDPTPALVAFTVMFGYW